MNTLPGLAVARRAPPPRPSVIATHARTLRELLDDGARPSTRRSCDVVSRVLSTLSAFHRAGYAHGDVRVESVWIDETTGAVALEPARSRSPAATVDGDLVAVGLLLHQLLAPAMSPALRLVIARATAPDPTARFRTADELGDAVAAASISPRVVDDHVREQHAAILAAVRRGDLHEATRRALEVAATLRCHARYAEAALELEEAARGLEHHGGKSRRVAALRQRVLDELSATRRT